MMPGFSYSATTGNTFTARINSPVNTEITPVVYLTGSAVPDPDTRQLNTDLPVGSVKGNMSVTPLGGFSYNIPVFCSPGTNGVQPSISIQYNSQSGNGLLGWGWNLSGLSAITRAVKPYYADNNIKSINMVTDDDYAIDGNRLILSSGTQGLDGSKYNTELESFTTTTVHGSSGSGPSWFDVYNKKDGSVMEYGNAPYAYISNDQGTRLIWLLTKYQDVNGNYIKYNYLQGLDLNQVYLSSIQYTGNINSSLLPYNEIIFKYALRSDSYTQFQTGIEMCNSLIITDIIILNEGNIVKKYSFGYIYNFYSKLVSITEISGSNNYLNSTIFKYNEESTNASGYSYISTSSPHYFYYGDYNGDGKSDIIIIPNKASGEYTVNDKIKLYINQDGTNFTVANELPIYSTGIPLDEIRYKDHIPYPVTNSSFDIQGDGENDFYTCLQVFVDDDDDGDPDTWKNLNEYFLYSKSQNKLTYFTFDLMDIDERLLTGDFDGDGYTDRLFYKLNASNYFIDRTTSIGLGWNSFTTYGNIPGGTKFTEKVGTADFNGNGKADFYMITTANYLHVYEVQNNQLTEIMDSLYFKYVRHTIGDLNGDGKTDIYGDNYNEHRFFFSDGKFFNPVDFIPAYNPTSDSKFNIDDLNGDGKGDLSQEVVIWESVWDEEIQQYINSFTTNMYIYLFNGSGFTSDEILLSTSLISDHNIYFADLNGDGQVEVIYRDEEPDYSYLSYFVRIKPDDKSRLLKTITDGFNNISRVTHGCLPKSTSYITSSDIYSFPVRKLCLPLYIVENVKNYGRGKFTPFSNVSYTYQDFRIHIQGKGALGFYKVTDNDAVSTAKTETEYSYGSTFFNVYPSKIKQYMSNTLLSETTNTEPVIFPFDSNHRYFAYIPNTITENKLNGTKTEVASTVDNSGNLTAKTAKYKSQSGSIIKQVAESYSIFDNFGNPTNISVTTTRGSLSITRTKSIEYYPITGLLKKATQNFSPQPNIETSYTYDIFGNMLTETTLWNEFSRTVSKAYEPGKGRFIISKTNPINHSDYFNTDPALGLTLKDSTLTGLVTSYDYDDFGNLISTQSPAGNIVSKSRQWSLGIEGVGETFCEIISSQNSPTKKTYFDYAGKEKRSKTQSFNGTYLVTDLIYDSKQRLIRKNLPYFEGNSPNDSIAYLYDTFNRIIYEKKFPGPVIISYVYYDSELKTKITKGGQDYYRQNDASGLLYKATDPGGTITYNYNAEDKVRSILSPSGETTIDYDIYGFQDKLHDLDAGTIDYDYNGFGELKQQTDNNGNIVKFDYDDLGRLTQKAWTGGETITYSYHPANEMITKISSNLTGYEENLAYDNLSRISLRSESFDGNEFTASYSYNQKGDITTTLINSTVSIVNLYNNYGFPYQVKVNNQPVWTANSMDKYNQVNNFTLGNQANTNLSYDTYGFLDKIITTKGSINLQNWDYDFNYLTGNLTKRKGLNSAGSVLEESFTVYDQLNRLKTSTIGANTSSVNYDYNGLGNIISKTDAGTYDYTGGLHNVVNILNPTPLVQNMPQQLIEYTKYNKVNYIKDTYVSGEKRELFITYGTGEERMKTIYKINSVSKKTKYFALGSYEKEIYHTTGISRELYYVSSPSGIIAVMEKKNSTSTIYYLHTDHLGSFDVVSNPDGTVKERYKFDAWGRRRNPVDWTYNNIPTSLFLDRGFTGHEHLDQFTLINMNGRVYDPVLAMFLSTDNFVQTPDLTINFNRYSYCLNNPLKYTDPDGEWFITALFTLANMYFNGAMANNFQLNPAKWDWRSIGTYTSMVQGGFSGWQIGSRVENKVNSFLYRKQFDRYSDMIIDDFNRRFELKSNYPFEGYTASLDGVFTPEFFMSLGSNEPFLTGISYEYPNNRLGKYDLRLQVYGSMYEEYNWIQTANWGETGWGIDPNDWRYHGGFYYNRSDINIYGPRYKKPDADFFFQDAPNAERFNAQLTLCGRRGESWYSIQTFDWGYEFNEMGTANGYFNKAPQVFKLHKQNIISTLHFFNFNYFILP